MPGKLSHRMNKVESQITNHESRFSALARDIKSWGAELGFQQVGIADCELGEAETRLLEWVGKGFHGEMEYMERHGTKRTRPAELIPGTLRVIAARMNYSPPGARDTAEVLKDGSRAFISRYALGRDYHKLMRSRMQKLADKIGEEVGEFRYRVFTDSAPVMEVELAGKAGLGWRGKHTLLLNREAGSYFFLGEIYTDLPLPVDAPQADHCGTCQKCLDVCPTQGLHRAVPARRAALHFLPHHRAQGLDPGRTAAADRQPGLRLRRLPDGLPLEQVRITERRARLRGQERPRRRDAGRIVLLDGGTIREEARGECDTSDRV